MDPNFTIGPGYKPVSSVIPEVGDIKFDIYGQQSIYNGNRWVIMSPNSVDDQQMIKMRFKRDMEKHFEEFPALKEAWEQYELIHEMIMGNADD